MTDEQNILFDIIKIGFGTIAGVYLGYKLNIGRDKRKEFNTITDPLRQKIKNHLKSLKDENINYPSVVEEDFDIVLDHLDEFNKTILKGLIVNYFNSVKNNSRYDSYGNHLYLNKDELAYSLNLILNQLKRK